MKKASELGMVRGKNINLRIVTVEDAEFILNLRLNAGKNRFLSHVANSLEQQVGYIEKCSKNVNVWYFIIESLSHEALGTVRIYDIRGDSFCWGSWILKDNVGITVALESALLVYDFGFFCLGFKKSHFDVRKGNTKVVKFHEKMGAQKVGECSRNFYFEYFVDAYKETRQKFLSFLG